MELKPGYKQTKAGIIPAEWSVDTLASTTPQNAKNGIVDGPFGSNLKTIHYKKRGIPIITSGFVTDGVFFANDYLYVDVEKFKQEKRSAVNAGDIVIAKIGARCGASAIMPEWHEIGILSGNSMKITIDKSRHCTYYIWQILWFLYSCGEMEMLRTVGAQPAISMAILKKLAIPLPPLPEQRAIAAALSDTDALLSSLDRLLAKKRDIKQAVMQQLLTGKQRLPGFSGEWEVKRLGDVVNDFIVPMRDKPKKFQGEIPWCRIEDFDGKYLFASKSDQCVDPKTVAEMNLKIYPPGTLLVSCSADLGRCAIVGKSLVTNQTFIGLVVDDVALSNEFLYYYMIYNAKELNDLSSGTTISYLSREQFEIFKINMPSSKAEQSAIAAVLSDMDAEIDALSQRRDKTRAVKQGMMQELLTGRTRLV